MGVSNKPFPVSADENPAYDLNYTGDDLTEVIMTVNGRTFTKTLVWAGGKLDTVSGWVES